MIFLKKNLIVAPFPVICYFQDSTLFGKTFIDLYFIVSEKEKKNVSCIKDRNLSPFKN